MWINLAQTAGKKDEQQILAKVFWIGDNLVSNDPRNLVPAKIRTTLAAMSGALKSRLRHIRSYCMAYHVFELDGESYLNGHWYHSYRVSVHSKPSKLIACECVFQGSGFGAEESALGLGVSHCFRTFRYISGIFREVFLCEAQPSALGVPCVATGSEAQGKARPHSQQSRF